MHGLSTLNRLLGKKNKEASRSTSNLSQSTTTNLDTSSQHNRITPIVTNAPFEQTFRVTVYLPKNQLYVERIGALTKLATLMDSVCENKHLTPDKYEFRHPGDMSKMFDTDKTIGEVGLNELKLVLKTESRFNSDFHRFHADDMLKYKSSVPDSVSSSEISRNYSKNVLQKPSPYSSTTSLNSLDSTGMNLTAKTQPPVAPARKKRAAPRPPSQNSIPEQEIFGTTFNVFKEPHSILPKKNFHVSSPQLYNHNINNNNNHNNQQDIKSDKNNNIESGNRLNAITRPTSLYVTSSTTEINRNGSAVRQRSPSSESSSEVQQILYEKHNSNSLEKKKKPAPVPPKRVHKPVPSPRTVQDDHKTPTITEIKEIDEHESPSRLDEKLAIESVNNNGNVSKTMLNNGPSSDEFPSVESSDGPISIQITSSDNSIEPVKEESTPSVSPKLPAAAAVSKVHIKHEEERRSSSEDEMTVNIYNVTKSVVTLEKQNNVAQVSSSPSVKTEMKTSSSTTISAQHSHSDHAQSVSSSSTQMAVDVKKKPEVKVHEIREVSPIKETPARVVSPTLEIKLASPYREASPPSTQDKKPTIEEPKKSVIRNIPIEIEHRSPSPSWTYTLPAPPVFADSSVVDKVSPTDRQKSGDKFFSDFASTDCNETILSDSNTTVISAETQIHPIIVDRRPSVENFIVTPKEYTKNVADDDSDKSTEIITSDLEDGYLGNANVVAKAESVSPPPAIVSKSVEKEIVFEDFKRSRLLISRSDSFHSISQARNFDIKRSPFSPPQRSTSFLSLVQSQKAEMRSSMPVADNAPYIRQKSTSISELSISDAPMLQSIEVLKNILNSSRKNSLQDASPKEEKVVSFVQEKSIEPPSPKVEEKIVKAPEPVVEIKPAEKQWRYSGPPKINLSTWSERPKVEVAIAADRDYKFGVGTATLPRDFKNNQEVKRHTIHITKERIPTQEAEMNTKPKVLGVEYKKDVSPVLLRDTSAEIVTKPSRTIINIKPRPMSMDASNTYSTIVTSTTPSAVSYNRLNSNAKKFSPVVHGFKLNNIKEGDQTDSASIPVVYREPEKIEKKVATPPSVPVKPAFLRSTSSGDIGRKMKFSIGDSKPDPETLTLDLPFSQTGLRRTGLKEKILESDKDTKSIFGKVVEPREQQSFIRQSENSFSRPPPEPKVERVTYRSVSIPAAPPKPPTAPPPMSFRKSAPVDMGTRSQLFDAIKNFNKTSLRHK